MLIIHSSFSFFGRLPGLTSQSKFVHPVIIGELILEFSNSPGIFNLSAK